MGACVLVLRTPQAAGGGRYSKGLSPACCHPQGTPGFGLGLQGWPVLRSGGSSHKKGWTAGQWAELDLGRGWGGASSLGVGQQGCSQAAGEPRRPHDSRSSGDWSAKAAVARAVQGLGEELWGQEGWAHSQALPLPPAQGPGLRQLTGCASPTRNSKQGVGLVHPSGEVPKVPTQLVGGPLPVQFPSCQTGTCLTGLCARSSLC